MARKWLGARQTKYAAYATVYILVIVTIAVVINVLANRYNRSWDSTANKRYTLSDQTAKIVHDFCGLVRERIALVGGGIPGAVIAVGQDVDDYRDGHDHQNVHGSVRRILGL